MRKITQAEFDALPIVNGVKQCPSYTDYSAIIKFGVRCSFGSGCIFGLALSRGHCPVEKDRG